jgi:hypothetical protein
MRRHRNTVPNPDVYNGTPDTLDDTEGLVSDHHPFAAAETPFIDVQIGAANCGRRQPQEHVGWSLEHRFGNSFEANLSRLIEYHCLHRISPPNEETVRRPYEHFAPSTGSLIIFRRPHPGAAASSTGAGHPQMRPAAYQDRAVSNAR